VWIVTWVLTPAQLSCYNYPPVWIMTRPEVSPQLLGAAGLVPHQALPLEVAQ
jgi:hypothetical protein